MIRFSGMAVLLMALGTSAQAAEYVIDGTGEGMHASVQWKASHMGISHLWGRFNDITGSFNYDSDNVEDASVEVEIATTSLDSNHEERDQHLMSPDYIDADEYPLATFVSTSVEPTGDDTMRVTGDFTFRDVTKEISFEATRTGQGETPFGDYRAGFEARTSIDAADFGIENIMPTTKIDLILSLEGVRQ